MKINGHLCRWKNIPEKNKVSSTLIRELRLITFVYYLSFTFCSATKNDRWEKNKSFIIYKHLGPNSNVMNFFFHTFSLWIPLIHECIGHWSNVLLSRPTLHNRVNSFPKEHSCFGTVYPYARSTLHTLLLLCFHSVYSDSFSTTLPNSSSYKTSRKKKLHLNECKSKCIVICRSLLGSTGNLPSRFGPTFCRKS